MTRFAFWRKRSVTMFAVIGVLLGIVSSVDSISMPADAGLELPKVEPPWPDGKVGQFHLLVAAAAGPCARHHPNVAASGGCGELSLGADVALSAKVRLTAEMGLGLMNSASSGDAAVGIARSTGGPIYSALRLQIGYDFTRLFFFHLGPQVRATVAFGRFTAGFQLNADLGTRVGDHLEVGVRTFGGFDGVASTGSPRWAPATCFGAALLARFLIQ